MSFCCLPKLSCFKPKSKARSATVSVNSSSKRIEKSFSFDRIKNGLNSSKQPSINENKSIADLCKHLNLSKSSSHKSMIAVRKHEGFEVLKSNAVKMFKEDIPSLNVSKISNVSYSDNSIVATVKEIVFPEKSELKHSISGNGLKKKKSLNVMQFINAKKKETPPMFLQNPCFSSNIPNLPRIDNNNQD